MHEGVDVVEPEVDCWVRACAVRPHIRSVLDRCRTVDLRRTIPCISGRVVCHDLPVDVGHCTEGVCNRPRTSTSRSYILTKNVELGVASDDHLTQVATVVTPVVGVVRDRTPRSSSDEVAEYADASGMNQARLSC